MMIESGLESQTAQRETESRRVAPLYGHRSLWGSVMIAKLFVGPHLQSKCRAGSI